MVVLVMSHVIKSVIIGGGQAGLALSYHLKQSGQEHIISREGACGRKLARPALGFTRLSIPKLVDQITRPCL